MKPETPLAARAAVRALTASKIRELYNEGIGRSDVLAFWVGEPDEPSPSSSARPASTRSAPAKSSTPTTWAFRSCATRWRPT
jgi:hypothetical protein